MTPVDMNSDFSLYVLAPQLQAALGGTHYSLVWRQLAVPIMWRQLAVPIIMGVRLPVSQEAYRVQ